MKDVTSQPAMSEEFRSSLKRCLEKAALINYGNLTAEVRLDGNSATEDSKDVYTFFLFQDIGYFIKINKCHIMTTCLQYYVDSFLS